MFRRHCHVATRSSGRRHYPMLSLRSPNLRATHRRLKVHHTHVFRFLLVDDVDAACLAFRRLSLVRSRCLSRHSSHVFLPLANRECSSSILLQDVHFVFVTPLPAVLEANEYQRPPRDFCETPTGILVDNYWKLLLGAEKVFCGFYLAV